MRNKLSTKMKTTKCMCCNSLNVCVVKWKTRILTSPLHLCHTMQTYQYHMLQIHCSSQVQWNLTIKTTYGITSFNYCGRNYRKIYIDVPSNLKYRPWYYLPREQLGAGGKQEGILYLHAYNNHSSQNYVTIKDTLTLTFFTSSTSWFNAIHS